MQKKINLSFYKSLLYCDFFLIKKTFYETNKTSSYFLKRFKSYNTLNLLESIKNFKRFILILKFISVFSFQQNKILLKVEDEWHISLLENFFKFSNIKKNSIFQIYKSLHRNRVVMNAERYLLCSIGSSALLRDDIIEKNFKNKIYLIAQFKLLFKNSSDGGYNLQTDFFDFKKLLFLILLMYKSCVLFQKKKFLCAF
jgi:hypothetical protein